jgi:hypothetical protein
MITSEQFDAALKVIADYKMESVKEIIKNTSLINRTINLQNQITSGTFKALQKYYENNYNIQLDWKGLRDMNPKLLSNLEFNKLLNSRGFGTVALSNLKKILVKNDVVIEGGINRNGL